MRLIIYGWREGRVITMNDDNKTPCNDGNDAKKDQILYDLEEIILRDFLKGVEK